MTSLEFLFVELRSQNPAVFLLLDAGLKSTLLMLLLVVVLRGLRHWSAGMRYVVMLLGLAALLVLPAMMAVLPNWDLAVLPPSPGQELAAIQPSLMATKSRADSSSVNQTDIPTATATLAPLNSDADCGCLEAEIAAAKHSRNSSVVAELVRDSETASAVFTVVANQPVWLQWCLGVWAVVAGWITSCTLMGMIGWRRLVRQSTELTNLRWCSIRDEVMQSLQLRRRVRLMQCDADIVPMAGGIFRPAVVLPATAETWSDERCRVVLLHELTHVRRWDPAAVLAARFVCAFYWFHPLVWLGAKWLQTEREHSCDDRVLAAGYLPSQYGRHLLEIAGASRSQRSVFAVGMPRRSQIEDRLRAILATNRRREPLTWRTVSLMALTFLAVVVPIATVQLRTHAAETASESVVAVASESDELGSVRFAVDLNADSDFHSTDNQFCQSSLRNNVSADPHHFTAKWMESDVRWRAKLGSVTFGSPVVSGGRVFIGTNNGAGYLQRYSPSVDLGCLLCFRESDGEFLWQYSSQKLETGRIHDWPLVGICSSPLVDGRRVWFVSNRCELVCIDALGFRDGVNNGPITNETSTANDEADVVWKLDMIAECGVSPHNMSNCSVTSAGDLLFVVTSNGRGHFQMDAPNAPSFLAVEKSTGKLVWSDASPGEHVLHGQWGSPAYGVIDGVPQVIFPGGDGWLYSFDVRAIRSGRTRLLWKFDCNSKASVWKPAGKGTRNNLVATPVIDGNHVFIANGQEPQNGEGAGCLWCIDATGRGDISSQLITNAADPDRVESVTRRVMYDSSRGDEIVANPNSGLVWKYDRTDLNGDGRFEFHETMHRAVASVVVADGRVIVPDIGGLVHCLDAHTGQRLWAHDLMAVVYSAPLVVSGKVFVCDEDGDIEVLALADQLEVLEERTLNSSIYSTPTVANGTLFFATRNQLLAVRGQAESIK